MWNGPGWGPMYGWWFMPLFAIIFLVILLFIISRFFSAGGFCGRGPMDRRTEDEDLRELRKEIRELRDEIRELKKEKQ